MNPLVGRIGGFASGPNRVALQPFQLVLRFFESIGGTITQLGRLFSAGRCGLPHQLLDIVQHVLDVRYQLVPRDRFHGIPPRDLQKTWNRIVTPT